MTRKLKTLGLALMATFAMSAVVASAASAVNTIDTLTPEASPETLTGAQEGINKFTIAGQSVECTTATFHATTTGTAGLAQVTGVVPTYGSCTYGGNTATITMDGCTYTLKGETDLNAKSEAHATALVVCADGHHISIDVPAIHCTITVINTAISLTNGSQTATEGYTITTVGAGATRELLLHLTATVKVDPDRDAGTDDLGCTNSTGNGKLTGTVKITGETDTGTTHTGITDSPS